MSRVLQENNSDNAIKTDCSRELLRKNIAARVEIALEPKNRIPIDEFFDRRRRAQRHA